VPNLKKNDRGILKLLPFKVSGHFTRVLMRNRSMLVYRLSQKWRTNGALRCRRDYRKRQKNVKKILLDLFADLAVLESGT
jgi:hypothetical protein